MHAAQKEREPERCPSQHQGSARQANYSSPHPAALRSALLHAAQYNWPTEKGNGDALGEGAARLAYPPLVIRAGTHLDTHLTAQPFSNCTAPLVRHAATLHAHTHLTAKGCKVHAFQCFWLARRCHVHVCAIEQQAPLCIVQGQCCSVVHM